MKPFREALADLVQLTGLQQLDIAVRAGISEGSISLYLTGRRSPRPTTLAKLAAAFDLPPEYFREYREWKAKQLVEEAMSQGLIDLEDVELILAGKRYRESSARKKEQE